MSERRRHETRDLSIRAILFFALVLLVFGGASHVALTALFDRYRAREERRDTPPPPARAARVGPPTPRLQEKPSVVLEELRRREELQLTSYGWVDRERGIVRIPIERAMKLILERGVPARPAPRTDD